MSSLTQQAADYIKFLGVEKAAERFSKKPSTIKRWISNNEYPIAVAEAALQEREPTSEEIVEAMDRQLPPESGPVEAWYPPAPAAPIETPPATDLLSQVLVKFSDRLANIEDFLSRISAPPPPPPPVREPTVVTGKPPESANIRPVFTTKGVHDGVAPTTEVPETRPDTFGATMRDLLKPYNYAARRR